MAIKIRNQCHAIIRASLNDGIDPLWNGEYLLISRVAPNSNVFIDVGANVGNWSELFISRMSAPKLAILVEPNPSALERLRARSRRFPCTVRVVDKALSDGQGEAVFYSEALAGETSSILRDFSRQDAEAVDVRLTTVDALFSDHRIHFCDFLKIDAEGFDFKILNGAINSLKNMKIGIIQFEYNVSWALGGGSLGAVARLLEELGYHLFLLKRDGLWRLRYNFYGEYLGYSNFVAVLDSRLDLVSTIVREKI